MSEVNAEAPTIPEPTDNSVSINGNETEGATTEHVSASVEPQTVASTPETAEANSASASTQPLSKKAQKRAAKQAYFAEKKLERRAREKEVKKEKKRQRRERQEHIAAGEDVSEDEDAEPQPERKKARKEGPVRPFNARVVVDLGFDGMMSEKEIISLTSQLAYTYSANRKARCPFKSLLFTSLDKRTRKRLDSLNDAGYRRWMHTEWWEQGYDRLWTDEDAGIIAGVEEGKGRSRCEKEKVVYLTADAVEELEELKEGETYIIGGICDHNRYKNLCQNKAQGQVIRSARLPIGRYLAEMTTRKVLTVNQVFEIMVHWTESRIWEEALHSAVPKRKFEQGGKSKSRFTTPTADIAAQGDTDRKAVGLQEQESIEETCADLATNS